VKRGFRILSNYKTNSGGTTLLNALGKLIPRDERILLIEDTAEIQLVQLNLVRFEARREQNAVSIRDLLRASLRHRPDLISLCEIRGSEAFDLLQLLNTGHAGRLSTIHASSAKQGLARFTSCVLQSGVELPYRAIKTNIGDSLNVVVHIERRPGRRFITDLVFRVLQKWKEQSRSDSPYVFPSLRKPGHPVGSVKTTWRSTLRRAATPRISAASLRVTSSPVGGSAGGS
jgi:pilus assembly protein CpaF